MAKGSGFGRWPGIEPQLREGIRKLGYWDAEKQRLQVMKFAEARGYPLMNVLGWLRGKQPSWEYVVRLAREFEWTPARLMFGTDGGDHLVTSTSTAPAATSRRS